MIVDGRLVGGQIDVTAVQIINFKRLMRKKTIGEATVSIMGMGAGGKPACVQKEVDRALVEKTISRLEMW